MPTAALHSHFWAGSAGAPPPSPPTGTGSSYQRWMTNVTVGGGFGVMQVVWEWAVSAATTTEWHGQRPRA